MFEADTLDSCLIEQQPYGSFPTWSLKDVHKTALPEFEADQVNPRFIAA